MEIRDLIREEIEQYEEAFVMVIRDNIAIKYKGEIEMPTFEELEEMVIEKFIDLYS